MRIVYVLDAYFPHSVGGTEMYTAALAADIRDMGHEVNIVIPDFSGTLERSYTHNGIRIHTYNEPSASSRKMLVGLEKPEGLPQFKELISELDPDVVHFQMISAGQGISLYHLQLVKELGKRTVLTMHLSHYTCLTGNLVRNGKHLCDGIIGQIKCSSCYLNTRHVPLPFSIVSAGLSGLAAGISGRSPFLYRVPLLSAGLHVHRTKERLLNMIEATDRICAITGWYRNMLLENGVPADKITLIRQGVVARQDAGGHPAQKQEPAADSPQQLRLIFIGRISRIKGLHVLLEALKGLDNRKYLLDIYGLIGKNNDFYQECQRFTSAHGLSVEFKGAIPHQEIFGTLSRYDLLCLPSLFSEMSPLVIQEAFKTGTPVIGSEVPGITEEVKNGINGFIFPFDDADALRTIFAGILNDPGVIRELKKNIVPPRNFEEVSRETMAVYNEIAGSNNSAEKCL